MVQKQIECPGGEHSIKTLQSISWEDFRIFLTIDKRHTQNANSVSAEKSRFNKIQKFFSSKNWDKNSFREFLFLYKDNAQGTINKYISMGKLIDGYLGSDVARDFKTKAERVLKVKSLLKPEEIKSLSEVEIDYGRHSSFLNSRQKALIMLIGITGSRISEMTNLQWENLNELPQKHIELLNTKNGDSRSALLSNDVYDLLVNLPKRSKYVFSSCTGNKLSTSEINNDLKRRACSLGLNINIHTHIFRHSFATTMLENGVSDTDVCILAGWRDPKMLLRYKNSDLQYLSLVLKSHPLLRHELTWEEKAKLCRKVMRQYFPELDNEFITKDKEGEFFSVTMKIT